MRGSLASIYTLLTHNIITLCKGTLGGAAAFACAMHEIAMLIYSKAVRCICPSKTAEDSAQTPEADPAAEEPHTVQPTIPPRLVCAHPQLDGAGAGGLSATDRRSERHQSPAQCAARRRRVCAVLAPVLQTRLRTGRGAGGGAQTNNHGAAAVAQPQYHRSRPTTGHQLATKHLPRGWL